jgi:hypothetical protein
MNPITHQTLFEERVAEEENGIMVEEVNLFQVQVHMCGITI